MSRIAAVVLGMSFAAAASGCARSSPDRAEPASTRDEVSQTTVTSGAVPAASTALSNDDMSARDRSGAMSAMPRDPIASAQDKGDFALAKDIRDAVMADESISNEARGVSITVRNGTVTLRGTVEDGREHDIVLQLARERAGIAWVVDELDVAP